MEMPKPEKKTTAKTAKKKVTKKVVKKEFDPSGKFIKRKHTIKLSNDAAIELARIFSEVEGSVVNGKKIRTYNDVFNYILNK